MHDSEVFFKPVVKHLDRLATQGKIKAFKLVGDSTVRVDRSHR